MLACLLKPFDSLRNIGPQRHSCNALGSERSSSALPMLSDGLHLCVSAPAPSLFLSVSMVQHKTVELFFSFTKLDVYPGSHYIETH